MLSGTVRAFQLVIHPTLSPEDPTVQRFINNLRETEVRCQGSYINLCPLTNPSDQVTIRQVSAPKKESIELREVGQVERVNLNMDIIPDIEVLSQTYA